jgi:hypothetical protein
MLSDTIVSVGDNVTGLTTSIGNHLSQQCQRSDLQEAVMEVKGTTDDGRDYLNI